VDINFGDDDADALTTTSAEIIAYTRNKISNDNNEYMYLISVIFVLM